ncbi:MAG: sugar ABC transporter permease [Clostridia bacterium]|nr:sugar ABC transporter permease [Clostridia bacterium]
MAKAKKRFFNKKLLFYCCLIAFPLLQYIVFYIYVNFNSIVLAFSSYDKVNNVSSFAGFQNFVDVFNEFFNSKESVSFGIRLKNSLLDYLIKTVVGTGGALFFSYYIYKKKLGGGLFKVILFLPQVIPGIVLTSIFRFSVDSGIVNIYNTLVPESSRIVSLLSDANTVYGTVLFYALFISFGTQTMMYLGAMNKINPSITEAGQLDGVSYMREFVSITLPCIFSTIATFLVVGLTTIFTSDLGLYSFFSGNAPGEAQTLGYYLFRLTNGNKTNLAEWPFISAIGVIFTLIVAPITLGLRKLMAKFDPMN